MKKIIILLACIACLVGCNNVVSPDGNDIEINDHTVTVFDIDSCEYIGRIYGSNSDFLTHKGNCKYCRERNKPDIPYGGNLSGNVKLESRWTDGTHIAPNKSELKK